MSVAYARHVDWRGLTETPQTEPFPGTIINNAGGFSFAVDHWVQLDRFLVLGSTDGTYYVSERKLTRDNAKSVEKCLAEDGRRVVQRVVEISDAGRAPKNDPALFVLAMAAGLGDGVTRKAALAALPKVARIGTHLFHFAAFVEAFRGWGRGLKRAVADWYLQKPIDALALDLVKYRQRDGWSHRDLLRLSHPRIEDVTSDDAARAAAFNFAVGRGSEISSVNLYQPRAVYAFLEAQRAATVEEIVRLIQNYDLPREAIPTQFLTDPNVWRALLKRMPMTAMVRNLGVMTARGVLDLRSAEATNVVNALRHEDVIRKSRLHPLSILVASRTYAQGHGDKGKLSWTPNRNIVDALDDAFYAAFNNVVPTGKRIRLALDVSGSMSAPIAGMPINCREASAALALVTMVTEKNTDVVGFTSSNSGWGRSDSGLTKLNINSNQRLSEVVSGISRLPFGRTDCSLPILDALEKGLKFDSFIVYTDSETYSGRMQPVEALRKYRAKTGIPAKLIVVGMTSSGFSIADPKDAGMVDIVGMDTATPALISDFIRN